MLLNFKILAFFWRQFYQGKGRETVQRRPRLQRVRSRKRVRSGPEIRSTGLHLLKVRGLRTIGSVNSGETNSQKRLLGFPSYKKPSLKIS